MFRIIGILVVVGSLACLAAIPVSAGKVQLTLASTLSPKSTIEMAAKRYADIIVEKTDGRIKITHYGSGSLYNPKDLIPALAKNQVNMAIHHVSMVGRRSGILEFIGSFGAMGCWSSYDHYFRFIDRPEVRAIADAEFDSYFNAKLLAMLAFGTGLFAHTEKPIETLADFKGLKTRSSGTAHATLLDALGAVGVEMSSKEIYIALQRGTIDCCSAGTSRVRRARLYEVAPHITIDPMVPYLSFWLVINKDVWCRLSPEDQDLLMGQARALEPWTRDFAAKERQEDLDFIVSKTKSVHELPLEVKRELVTTVKPAMMEYTQKRLGEKYQTLWNILNETK